MNAVVDVTGSAATVVSSTGAIGIDVDVKSMNKVEVLDEVDVLDAVDDLEVGAAETDKVELVVSLALAARTG